MIEKKVTAATAAAAVSGLLLWILGTYVFRGDVPEPVVAVVWIAVPSAFAFVAGYLARHTARPDLTTPPANTVR